MESPRSRAFDDVIADLDRDFQLPPPARPTSVRARLQQALANDDFCLECARIALHSRSELFTDPHGRYTLKLFCWPPGFGNEPHRHDIWTVACILAGSLQVSRSTVSAADCLASAPRLVRTGDVGTLTPPQFHCLRNDAPDTAISLHLFNLDGSAAAPSREDGAADAPKWDDEETLALARLAAERGWRAGIDCVQTAFAAVGPATKLEAVKLMFRLDPERALALGRTLSQLVGGEDGARLLDVIERLDTARNDFAVTS